MDAGHTTVGAGKAGQLIDLHTIILDMDGPCGAGLDALGTVDTPHLAYVHNGLELILGRAIYRGLGTAGNKLKHVARAYLCALATARTRGGIDMNKVILNVQGVERTGRDAIAKTKAGITAHIGPAVQARGGGTGRYSLIVIAAHHLTGILITPAEADERLHFCGELTRKFTNSGGTGTAAYDAEIGLDGRIFHHSLRITFTARKTTAAAIGSGQFIQHAFHAGIFLNGKNP